MKIQLGNGQKVVIAKDNKLNKAILSLQNKEGVFAYTVYLTFENVEALAAEFDFLMRTW